MLTVYKYQIPPEDHLIIDMPKGARILHVGSQYNVIMLWALVDPSQPKVTSRFRLAETGRPIDDADCGNFVGTAIICDGALVFHLFDLG